MKHCIPLFSFLVTCLGLLSACTSKEYDTGDGEYSYMRADFADVRADADKKLRAAMTDDGDSLVLDTPLNCSWISKGDSIYRALLYYSREFGSGPRVRGISAHQVMLLAPSRLKEGARMFTDPVVMESSWLAANGRYFNLGMYVKTGKPNSDQSHHTVGVVRDTVITFDDGSREHRLRLFHNRGGVPEYYSSRLYVSIPLAVFAKGDRVRMEANTYEGTFVKTFEVK